MILLPIGEKSFLFVTWFDVGKKLLIHSFIPLFQTTTLLIFKTTKDDREKRTNSFSPYFQSIFIIENSKTTYCFSFLLVPVVLTSFQQ
mmetsp:Transcript_18122/g.27176  ORF Transcript_18122/g.27176 Transcript_18122/m.27176 type:complete len:88 (-) Transcript_18122:1029-1292(-)